MAAPSDTALSESTCIGGASESVCHLLRIPRELRGSIYEYSLVVHDGIIAYGRFDLAHDSHDAGPEALSIATNGKSARATYQALSLTSRQIREEAKTTFFRYNTFGAWVDESRKTLPGLDGDLQYIQHLQIRRYGCWWRATATGDVGVINSVLDLTFAGTIVEATVLVGRQSLYDTVMAVAQQRSHATGAEDMMHHTAARERVDKAILELAQRVREEGALTRSTLDNLTADVVGAWW